MFKRLCVAIAALALASCALSGLRPAPPGGLPEAGLVPQTGQQATQLPPAGRYQIYSSGSELRVLVYRAGALANLGHNHVITNRSVTGSIDIEPTVSASSFSLSAPVAAFIVDDTQARAEEGEDFTGEISDEAKTGTYNNMTGALVLNSSQYPVIGVRSTWLEQSTGNLTAILAVNVAGHQSTISVPFLLSKEAYGLSASASFELRQSALGLTPFSLMLGALAVRDVIHVKLKVAAQLEAPR